MRSFFGQTVEAITLQSSHSLSSRAELDDLPANQSGGVEGPAVFTEALTDNYLKLRLEGRHEPNRWLEAQVAHVVNAARWSEPLTKIRVRRKACFPNYSG